MPTLLICEAMCRALRVDSEMLSDAYVPDSLIARDAQVAAIRRSLLAALGSRTPVRSLPQGPSGLLFGPSPARGSSAFCTGIGTEDMWPSLAPVNGIREPPVSHALEC